jgi:hypothetical protein
MSFFGDILNRLRDRGIEPDNYMKGQSLTDGSTLLDLGAIHVRMHPDQHSANMLNPGHEAEIQSRLSWHHNNCQIDQPPVLHLTRAFAEGIHEGSPNLHGLEDTIGRHENSHIADILHTLIQNPPPDYRGYHVDDFARGMGSYLDTTLRCSESMTDLHVPGHMAQSIDNPGWQNYHDLCNHFINQPNYIPNPPQQSIMPDSFK